MSKLDLSVQNEGTILILRTESGGGRAWIREHISDEAQRWGAGVVVEHRYIRDIVEGARGDGLTVGPWKGTT